MGLDQYAFSVYKKGSEEASEEIAYWRKHNALHGWMQKLYISKGGKGDMEYGPLELSLEDVKSLGYDTETTYCQKHKVSFSVMILGLTNTRKKSPFLLLTLQKLKLQTVRKSFTNALFNYEATK